MNKELQQAWEKRKKLWAEGSKLYAEGSKLYAKGNKLRAEGSKLWAEGSKLWTEGYLIFINAVIKVYGKDARIEWLADGSCKVSFGNEEIYKA